MNTLKIIICSLLLFSSLSTYAQQIEFNFVMIAEAGTSECDLKDNVFFVSPVLKTTLTNLIDRHDILEGAKEDYLAYLDTYIYNEYPEYMTKECILELKQWPVFEEWALVNTERLKEHIGRKYSTGKIINTNFALQSNETVVIEKKVKEVDPNQALIDAYYLQAEKEFNAKHYEKSLSILDKAKGLLGDKKDLSVMLLEAQSKIMVDKNINDTKSLLNEFVKEAAKQNDKRLNEGANLLVSLETSDAYYDTGFKKEFEYTLEQDNDVVTCQDKLDKNGNVLFSKQLSGNWNDAIIKEIDNRVSNEQKVINYNQKGSVKSREYYVDGLPVLITYNKQNRADYYYQGNLSQSVVYNDDRVNISVFNKEGKDIFGISDVSVLNKTSLKLTNTIDSGAMKLGLITEIKELLDKGEYNTYNFDGKGFPEEKLYHKKEGKVKDTYKFDKATSSWNVVK